MYHTLVEKFAITCISVGVRLFSNLMTYRVTLLDLVRKNTGRAELSTCGNGMFRRCSFPTKTV